MSQVAWLSVFADVPVDRLERAQRFWECATATSAGTPSGAHGEFVPLEPEVLRLPGVQRVFIRITLLWAFVNLANAVVSITLLLSQMHI